MTNPVPPDSGATPPPPGPTWYAGQAAAPAGGGLPPTPAPREARPGLVAGVILVVAGGAILLERVLQQYVGVPTWPAWIVIPGIAMLVGSLFIPPRGGLGLAVPGAIIASVGLVLWVQDVTGLYSTWAYAWALVAPTAPGVAMLLYGAVHRDGDLVGDGLRSTLTGVALFAGFAFFFEGVIGLNGHPLGRLDEILPYALIGLGALFVVVSLLGGKRSRDR